MQRRECPSTHRIRVAAVGALLTLSSTSAHAQLPRQGDPALTRARSACDAAASRYGYRVLRRDRENVNGSSYQLPFHVQHGTTEADVTCNYDSNRGIAVLPPWDDRSDRVGQITDARTRRATNAMTREQYEVQRACENSVNSRPGYQVRSAGTPVAHGTRQWDVPLTVVRDGGTSQRVTCRYNTANGKVSLRPR